MNKKKPVKEVQEIRLAHRERLRKYPVATVYLQIVGSGAPGAPRALYVFTEHCRYLFNCGEGTQRLAYEHKVKLSMMEHVLITHKSWENVGGLPGALLTLQDTGVPQIVFHGPPGIESLYHDTKHFMRFADLKIKYSHYKNKEASLENGPLIVKSVPIWPDKELLLIPQELDKNTIHLAEGGEGIVEDLFGHENTTSKVENNSHSDDSPSVQMREQESIQCRDLAIAYICRPVPKPGALLPARCRELGVPNGPLLGQLKSGKDVTLSSGKVIKASDVTEPDDPGPVFIVIEVPSKSHLPSLLNSTDFIAHQKSTASKEEDVAQVIVHFTPPDVLNEPSYKEWTNKFSSSTTHIFINKLSSCMGSERVHKVQYKLNHLYPEAFPILSDTGIKPKCRVLTDGVSKIPIKRRKENSENSDKNVENCEQLRMETDCDSSVNTNNNGMDCVECVPDLHTFSGPCYQASTLLTYHIRPHLKIDSVNALQLDPENYVDECYQGETFEQTYKNIKNKIHGIQRNIPNDVKAKEFPNIFFMGTGSCIPNKTRNTSGILLNINPLSSMIIDCGEGTYGQLVRFMGVEASDVLLRKLKCIYVSHLHADHHIGLIKLILAREKAFRTVGITEIPKLFLFAPMGIIYYLVSYDSNFESLIDQFTLIPNRQLNIINRRDAETDINEIKKYEADILDGFGIKHLETCLVPHCPYSYGVAITLKDGWKMVYSGDTMPSDALVEIGKNCNLLIHEATMEDELKEDARYKRHSITSEAIEIGAKMKAENVILTHFSQRYAKVPLLNEVPENVAVAFDNMQVHLRDLPCLPHLYPAFVAIFSEDYDEMLEKTMKRKVRELEEKNQLELKS